MFPWDADEHGILEVVKLFSTALLVLRRGDFFPGSSLELYVVFLFNVFRHLGARTDLTLLASLIAKKGWG